MKEASTPTSFITSAPELGSTDQRVVCEQHTHTMSLCTPGSFHLTCHPSVTASWLVPWVSRLLLGQPYLTEGDSCTLLTPLAHTFV